MSGHSAISDSLREVGYRLTPQRMLIVSLIHDSKGRVTAEELHSRVVQQYPFVDISTVYRTLQLLKKLRLVSDTDLGGGRVQYELTQEARPLPRVCRHCGATSPLDDEMIEPLRGRLLEKHGFQADMEHFAIFGVCRKCAEKARAGGAGGRR